MLRFLTAGESHGEALVGILEGFPKGVKIDRRFIDRELLRRQKGFGRGKRMNIERDRVVFLSGIRGGISLGSPIAFIVRNKDKKISLFGKDKLEPITVPRPAHADLAGALKYKEKDIRNILERASARETALRVVVGALCKEFLKVFKIRIISFVVGVGSVFFSQERFYSYEEIERRLKKSLIGCIDRKIERLMVEEIKKAKESHDTLGGIIKIIAFGVPPGLGSFMHWDRRLDARLAFSLMSIPAVRGVEIGLGFKYATLSGRSSHDSIYYSPQKGFYHKTNNSGGIEGGMSNGEPIVLRIAMKPIATLGEPSLDSVDLLTKKNKKAPIIRSDVTAIYACSVIAESMVAYIILSSFLEKFSSDNIEDIKKNYYSYIKDLP